MVKRNVIRRVTKRTYDKYSTTDYATLSDNLNPINPTDLESQVNSMTNTVQKRIIEAYERAHVTPPEELYEGDVSPTTLLNSIDTLINKLKQNPLGDLLGLENGETDPSTLDIIPPIISGPSSKTSFLDNPLKLDCAGIESTLATTTPKNDTDENLNSSNNSNSSSDSNTDSNNTGNDSDSNSSEDSNDSNDSNNSGNNSDSSNGDDGDDGDDEDNAFIKITYKNLNSAEDMSKYPSTLREIECPVNIAIPTVIPSGQIFKGWYYDDTFVQKVINNSLDWPNKDITLYALIDESLDDDTNDSDVDNENPDLEDLSDDDDCDLIELSFLKIILIIIIIAKILITVLILYLNIKKTIAEILKDAELCWINPPSLQSLIAYVMQKLGAVIFQLLGMILLKIWSMLNLDCIGKNTLNTIDQINAAMAGMIDLLGSIDALAMQFGNSGSGSSIKDMIKNLKEQLTNMYSQLESNVSSMGDQIKAAGKDIADTYTNPATYLAAVPNEIKQTILSNVDAVEQTMNSIKKLQQTVNKLQNKKSKNKSNEIPKGVEVLSF